MKLTGENRSTRGKICPSATLPTTSSKCTGLGSNPGLRGGRPATNRLSRDKVTTLHVTISIEIAATDEKFQSFSIYVSVAFIVTIVTVHATKAYRVSSGLPPHNLNLGTR
jgi:hypothetical protein